VQLISLSSEPERIVRVLAGETFGTVFHARAGSVKGRKRWILSGECEAPSTER
jgi:glutamate 5-kinase